MKHLFTDKQIDKLTSYDDKLGLVAYIAYESDYISYQEMRSFLSTTPRGGSHEAIRDNKNRIEEYLNYD